MEQWKSVDEVLDFAIRNEEEARDFYTGMAGKMKNQPMRTIFEGFAREEEGHREKLVEIKKSGGFAPSRQKVMDLKIGDYLVEPSEDRDVNYQDALIMAMKREKAAFKLYMDLAEATDDAGLKETMLALAHEEANHKLRFEIEYDDNFLTHM